MKQKRKAEPAPAFPVHDFRIRVKCCAGDYECTVRAPDEGCAARSFRAAGNPGRILSVERLDAPAEGSAE